MVIPGSEQTALPGLGPDADDRFRFTWWTTPIGGEVWVERRGECVKGRIVGRGRFYVNVEVISGHGKRRRVKRLYSQLRRSR